MPDTQQSLSFPPPLAQADLIGPRITMAPRPPRAEEHQKLSDPSFTTVQHLHKFCCRSHPRIQTRFILPNTYHVDCNYLCVHVMNHLGDTTAKYTSQPMKNIKITGLNEMVQNIWLCNM